MNWTDEDITRRNREVLGIDNPLTYLIDGPHAAYTVDPSAVPFPSADLKPEWMIEEECTKILEEDGWRALRTDPVSDRGRGKGFGELGMADHLYIRYWPYGIRGDGSYVPTQQVLWIEFKSAKGKPTSKQLEWHTKERARGALTLIAGQDFPASVEGFRTWYRASGLLRNPNA